MSAREEIETNRLLKNLLDVEFDKLVTESPEQMVQVQILATLNKILFQLELLTEVQTERESI